MSRVGALGYVRPNLDCIGTVECVLESWRIAFRIAASRWLAVSASSSCSIPTLNPPTARVAEGRLFAFIRLSQTSTHPFAGSPARGPAPSKLAPTASPIHPPLINHRANSPHSARPFVGPAVPLGGPVVGRHRRWAGLQPRRPLR